MMAESKNLIQGLGDKVKEFSEKVQPTAKETEHRREQYRNFEYLC